MYKYEPPKALIVHGMEYMRDELVRAFRDAEGYVIYTANSAELGKSMYVPYGVRGNGVVVIDPFLIGCDEALDNIRARDPNPKIIVLHKDHTPESVVSQANRLLGMDKPSLTEKVMSRLSITA